MIKIPLTWWMLGEKVGLAHNKYFKRDVENPFPTEVAKSSSQ